MKKIFNTITFSLSFIICIIASNMGAEVLAGERPDDNKANWVQYSRSKRVMVPKDLDFNGEIMVVEGIYTINITFETGFEWVKCCRGYEDRDAWCDLALQDKRC